MSEKFDFRTPEEFWPFNEEEVVTREIKEVTEEDWKRLDRLVS